MIDIRRIDMCVAYLVALDLYLAFEMLPAVPRIVFPILLGAILFVAATNGFALLGRV